MTEARRPHRYTESGLQRIVLANVVVRDCLVVIPLIEELHLTIARLLLEKREQLTGAEVTFLRKQPIGEATDLLLRTYVAHERATTPAAPLEARLEPNARGWQAAAA